MNTLYYGDNLTVLRDHIKDESIDLVYLDPPFKSNQNYNVLFQEKDGSQSSAQIKAFEDTWQWDQVAVTAYLDVVEGGEKISKVMQAMRNFLGDNDMLAYLSMMAQRLIELKRVIKPTGSIYLHCDPTASHYLKLLMDATFGLNNFRNEIIWSYKRYTAKSNRFQRLHDVILFYGGSDQATFNDLREDYGSKSGKADSHYKQDEDGNWYRWQKRKGEEPYKIPLSEGRRLGDVWEISHINASAKERLGYPTQKPESLLERIIKARSNEGDTVLDPFCGCGTTISVAHRLKRNWIGIDITHLAIGLIKRRLHDSFSDVYGNVPYDVIGEPTSLPDAIELAQQDPFQFQWWVIPLVSGRPTEKKKGKDQGIDGIIYFHDEKEGGKTKKIIISVKSGTTGPKDVRDLRGVLDREEAEIGVFITLKNPTKEMIKEAASAGHYKSPGWDSKHPKIQILHRLVGGFL